ncbi:MAG: HK97 family phage prohead protease [Phycisphaeraceae bacterium]|nr:HK97 family phage prohead protease [Phycisphaeraceae bacterium]
MTDMIRKQFAAQWSALPGERSVIAAISTSEVDRDGDVLIPQGCDAADFLRSPTVFYNHDYSLPVGKCVAIRRLDERLEAKTQFAQKPEGHPGPWLADVVLSLCQQGVINGFSVGFVPVESRKPSRHDRERFGPRVRHVHSKWKLLEYSVAPLPSNQDALVQAVSKGIVSKDDATSLWPGLVFSEELPRASKRLVMVMPSMPRSPVDVEGVVRRVVLRSSGRLYDGS